MEKKENISKENILTSLSASKPIYGITPFTLLDYPDKTACILWFAGCNMRCKYCYNPEIVFGKGKITFSDTLKFLRSRKGLLDGVVLSGGECTLHKNLKFLLQEIRDLGLLIKIDTNGTNTKQIVELIEENLVDYIALDFKSTEKSFETITDSDLFPEFNETLSYLVRINFSFEVRTTVHSDLISMEDIRGMVSFLEMNNYKGVYYLQNYLNDAESIGNLNKSKALSNDVLNINSRINIELRNIN